MKKIFSLILGAVVSFSAFAQEQSPQETARSFMRTGDWDNAILVLNKALQQDRNNLDLLKDLALSYTYSIRVPQLREQKMKVVMQPVT